MRFTFAVLVVSLLATAAVGAQGRATQAPVAARADAPIDLTGYWVALVTEDWRWRMITPKKGDFPSIPLNRAGQDLANAWDPARDASSPDWAVQKVGSSAT